jgi:AcrR family transcriptional regulator
VANIRTPRGAWIDAALQALAAGGPDAVRVEALAVYLGVSKGGFYWHFTDRQALLEETLDAWEKVGTEDVIARVECQPADPRAKLQQLFELAPSADFAVELALRDWSRRDSDVAERLRRVDNRRMGWLRSLFGQFCVDDNDVEARSMLAYSLLIGSYFIAAQHDDKTRSQILQLAVDRLLGESWADIDRGTEQRR